MVKSALCDERLWSYCKQFNPSKGYVVGLILGQPTKTVDYVIHLTRIPPPDNNKSSSGGGDDSHESKDVMTSGLSLTDMKEAWISNHACEVTRMLPGGMWVIGLFLAGQSDPFENQNSCSKLRSILRQMRSDLKKKSCLFGDSPSSEKLVLHINAQKNLTNCRSVDLDGSAAFKQTDFKFQKNPVAWRQIESTLNLNNVWHLNKKDSLEQLRSQFQVLLDTISMQVNESVITFCDELRDPDDLLESIFKKDKGKASNRKGGKAVEENFTSIAAQLYLHMAGTDMKSPSGVELSNGCGKMYIVGSPFSRVFVHQKATFDEACKAVKQDILRSIATRLEMHADSLVEEPGTPEDLETVHEPPRRVLIKVPSTDVTFSDYLFPGDGPEEALVSCKELLDLTIELENIEEDVEVPADTEDVLEWKNEQQSDVPGSESTASRESTNYKLLVALGALLVALIGFLISLFAGTSSR